MISTQREILTTVLMLALLLGAAGTAFAQNAGVGAQIDGAVDASVTDDVDASIDVSADADANVNADTDLDTSTSDSDSDTASVTGATFSLIRGDAAVDSASESRSATSVTTSSDLEAYAASTLRANDSLEGVDVTSENVVVSFKEQVRLLGIIPMNMTSRVEVTQDGAVRIERPWYSFLAFGASTELSSDMEATIRNVIAAEGGLTARAQAQVLNEVALALGGDASSDTSLTETVESSIDAALDANASADADASVPSGGTNASPQ